MSDDVVALVKPAFAAMGAGGWILMITPPLPLDWPDGPLVYYAYARRHRHGLVDGHEVSAPWARVERRKRLFGGHRLELVQLTAQPELLRVEGGRPLTDGEHALYAEIAAAGPIEDQLARARRDPAAALLVRRNYCHWKSLRAVAKAILPAHPAFTAFLDCDHVTAVVEPVLPPDPEPVARPEFFRRYGMGSNNPWHLGVTPGFPLAWPATPTTPIAYYPYAIRVERDNPVPAPREITEPFGVITRDVQGGPLRFTKFHDKPPSLGVQPGRAPPKEWFELLRSMDRDRDAMFLRAGDPVIAGRLRAWYREWIEDERPLAPIILPRHPAFAAFIRG